MFLLAEVDIHIVGTDGMPSWQVRVLRARGSEAPAVEFTEATMGNLLDAVTRDIARAERRKRWGSSRAEEDMVTSQYAGVYWCYTKKAWLAAKPGILCADDEPQRAKFFPCPCAHRDADPDPEVSAAAFASDKALAVDVPALIAA